jgi:hypothetical protein
MLQSTEKGAQRLRYYLHDDPDAFRMELAGSLTQPDAQSAYHAWRTARSVLGGRPVIVDISFVSEADEVGRNVLRRYHERGARIIARSPESRALADGIMPESAALIAPKLIAPQRNWGARLIARLIPAMRTAGAWGS